MSTQKKGVIGILTGGGDVPGLNPAMMILLHGFVKKSQKTPPNELDTARRRLNNLEKD